MLLRVSVRESFDVLANLQADKAIIELEAPSGGIVAELLVPADDEELLEIGTPVAILDC